MSSGAEFQIDLAPADLDGPLPFHLLIDEHLRIQHVGRSIRRLYPELKRDELLSQWLTLERPDNAIEHIDDLYHLAGRLILMRLKGCDLPLRGQFLPLINGRGAMLVAAPNLTDPDELTTHDLQLTDFATHDTATDLLFAIRARDVTLRELKDAMERKRVLLRELDHRVKNNLSSVLSLLTLTRSETSDIDQYYEILDRRIRALDASHTLLANCHWGPVDLGTLVDAILTPFGDQHARRTVNGPPVRISARQASPLAMSLHELATNAAKHGAWLGDTGLVDLQWKKSADDLLLLWTETGGSQPPKVVTEAVGLSIVRGFIEHELAGAISIDPDTAGVIVSISLPMA